MVISKFWKGQMKKVEKEKLFIDDACTFDQGFLFYFKMFWKKGYWKTQKDQALTIHEKNEMKMILSMSGLQISETAKQCTSSAFTNFVSTFWISKIEWKNIDEIMWNHYRSCKCQAALLGLKSTYFQTLSLDILSKW